MPLRCVLLFVWFLVLWFRLGSAAAQTEPAGTPVAAAAPQSARPRVALVLSGGGARGFAHIGVLRVLEELNVPVDMVLGVSMGAVVGGAYAAGRSVSDLEQFVRRTDWDSIVADRPPRDDLAFRRRLEDLLVPSRIEFGVSRHGVSLPPSAAGNAALESALAGVLPVGMRDQPVNDLPLPFRTLATDLLSGELVELSDTPLFMSMRASLAVPGVFPPVRANNRLVVDGGLVRNLPVDIAKAMGAEIVIAVNVGTPLAGESALVSALDVANQMLQILTEQNVQRSLKELGPADVLISPDLSGIRFLDFKLHERAIAAGEHAARQLAPRLQQLAVSPAHHAAWVQRRIAASNITGVALPLARLEAQATPHASAEALLAQSGLREGQAVTAEQVGEAASRLYGRGEFERVEVDVRDVDGRREVSIKPTEAEWARSRFRIGIELASDFADGNRFTVSAMHVASWLNSWGAELRTVARIGSRRSLGTEFWQPLAPGSAWYVAPSLEYDASSADLFTQQQRSARYAFDRRGATLAFGRHLSNWGDLRIGIGRTVGQVRVLVPEDPSLPSGKFSDTSFFLQTQLDTLDSLAFPSRGGLLIGHWERSLSARSGEAERGGLTLIGLAAFNVGDWDGHFYGEWARARFGAAPLSLGGFLRLSGTEQESISGRTVVLGRVVMAHPIAHMPIGLGGAVRAGFSLELGAGFASGQAIRLGDLHQAGSAFVSVDTRFGPLFLGAGKTRNIGATAYLFLGPFW